MTKPPMGMFRMGIWVSLVALVMVSTATAQDQQYQVTVTNVTAHQIFTPVLVVSHSSDIRLFNLGKAASEGLEMLAEGGATEPLTTTLMESDMVRDVKSHDAPLPPGQSATVVVTANSDFNRISVAAMLIPTNDAFVAVNSTEIPDDLATKTIRALGYDAGTEANDQLCDHIPGPPDACTDGIGFDPSRDGAEGFVHIHRGIHPIGDLAPETYDWRNPVANVSIRVMQ